MKLQAIEASRWKLRFRNETIEVRAQVERIIKVVVLANDLMSSAASSEPHAALTWACVFILLPVSTELNYPLNFNCLTSDLQSCHPFELRTFKEFKQPLTLIAIMQMLLSLSQQRKALTEG